MGRYKNQFGEKFCLVVFRTGPNNDAYIMPYSSVKDLFVQNNLDRKHSRWIGQITNHTLFVNPPGQQRQSFNISLYYNNIQLFE